MLRALVQSTFAALLILSARWYPMQEMLFWVAVVALLCGFGTIVVALVSWLRQTVRRGCRWIQRNRRGYLGRAWTRLPSRTSEPHSVIPRIFV
jgi:hypothetical protein